MEENQTVQEVAERRRKEMYSNVGYAVRKCREDAGYSLEDGAAKLGYKPEKLLNIEQGGHVSIPAFLRIVATFGGHVYIKAGNGSYSLEELTPIPPITQEEIDSLEQSREQRKKQLAEDRTHRWLDKMANEWSDTEDRR